MLLPPPPPPPSLPSPSFLPSSLLQEQPPTSQAGTTTEASESVTSAGMRVTVNIVIIALWPPFYLRFVPPEFDQFLAQRTTKGENLPPSRPRPKMQKAEDQSDELFSL